MVAAVHDSRVRSYRVSAVDEEIVLDIEAETGEEKASIVFGGVIGYRLSGDNFRTILFDISEVPAEELIGQNLAVFEDGARFGWPGIWNVPMRDPADHVRAAGARGFIIESSLGMEGWVLAKSLEIRNGAAR